LAKNITFRLLLTFLTVFLFILLPNPVFAHFPQGPHTLSEYHFSVPPGLERQVNFWKKIYSEYTTDYAVIHDVDNLDIIYEAVYLGGESLSRRAKDRKLSQVKNKYKDILIDLARGKNKTILTGDEKRVHDMVQNGFYRAAKNMRSQIGQKDRFQEGLVRSGRYMEEIKRILKEHNLPGEISALPHVESSFHEGAYSSAGAAGIWQFTRGTGRLFMRVRYDVDERRDPLLSTHAAAKLLTHNFEELQSWPLALTAYNHGTSGMKRAKSKYGDDIVKIIANYRSRTFGFASQNFYAEFLAALEVSKNEEKYFPNLTKFKPLQYVSMRFDDYVHIDSVMRHFNMTREEIAKSNPALRNPVITGQKRIPRGFVFKAPAGKYDDLEPLYQRISNSDKHDDQVRSKWYTVQRGDTLSGLALRFGTSVHELKRENSIGARNKIYVGKVLRLPDRNGTSRDRTFAVAQAKTPEPVAVAAKTVEIQVADANNSSYRVRRNDNLTKIAQRFNTNTTELSQLNNIKNPNSLYPGQTLVVPQNVVLADAANIVTDAQQSSGAKDKEPETGGETIAKEDRVIETEPGVKVQLASISSPAYQMNKNRPAFLPVTFDSEEHKVSRMGEITVDFDETLSHYAEWAQLSVSQVRRANKIRPRSQIPVHTKIKVPFTSTDPEKFEERRQEYHKAIQDDFFSNYRVSKLVVRKVQKGETLWEICNDIYFIPFWLLGSYNPDKDINTLSVGEPIIIPIITPIKSKDS